MKAIIVIDVPDGIDLGRYRANGLVRQIIFDSEEETMYSTPTEFHFCSLKPLPQKDNYEIADDHPFSKVEIMAYTYGITVGRNQVIEEITE